MVFVQRCARRMWRIAVPIIGGALLLSCGDNNRTSSSSDTGGPDSPGNPGSPGAPSTPQAFDPWHHRDGAGEVVEPGALITTSPEPGSFTLFAAGKTPPLVVSTADYPGVIRVVGDLQADIERVTGVKPAIAMDAAPSASTEVVLIGTLGRSTLVDQLVRSGKLDVHGVTGRWETFVIQPVEAPMVGVSRALVVAGSDQRGTIYGAYEISRKIGVSPWYYFDDVPSPHRDALYVNPARYTLGTPAVKYRGIFINDENPQLGGWGPAHFGPGRAKGYSGGFNKDLYSRIFETMLRLRANYLWPAVWGRAFALDDEENHATATRYGIVMGTSHEAPMMRGIEEWNRDAAAHGGTSDSYGGNGAWRFSTNRDAVTAYMRAGVQRMKEQRIEGVVTMGMRGPGDVSLPPEDGIPLIQDLITTQQRMLAEILGGSPRAIPKVWTLYKEVQDWYLRPNGIQVPDDITIVWAEDNWGNLRKLPDQTTNSERFAGYGIYYHFDYVGGPRNYKWVDSSLLPNIWEQANLAYSYGVDRVWVANVGDLKNDERPAEFFLDYAWAPGRWPVERIAEWERSWAAEQFGDAPAAAIAEILHRYELLQSDRKPELLNRQVTWDRTKDVVSNPNAALIATDANPFSLVNYAEHDRITAEWRALASRAEEIGQALPPEYQDAYYELVGYNVRASANLYALRLAQFTGALYADQGRAATNDMAVTATARFADDLAFSDHYNHDIAGGKWSCTPLQAPCTGWASQPHVGYGRDSSWQQPEINNWAIADFIWPLLRLITVPAAPSMGVAIDGSTQSWPGATAQPAVLPTFSPFQRQSGQYIDVFNRGTTSFNYEVFLPEAPSGLVLTRMSGRIDKQERLGVTVDWAQAPAGLTTVPIRIQGDEGTTVVVQAVIDHRPIQVGAAEPAWDTLRGFVEADGHVAMDAEHYTAAVEASDIKWFKLPDIGRTGAGMTVLPRNAPLQTPNTATPHLDYQMYLMDTSDHQVEVWTYLSPRNSVRIATGDQDGLLYAISVDDEAPQIVNATARLGINPQANSGNGNLQWEWKSADNVIRIPTTHMVKGPNPHVLRYWLVDPTVIAQRFVVDTGGLRPSYLGPPESCRAPEPCTQAP